MARTIIRILRDAESKWGNRDYIWVKKEETYVSRTFIETINDVLALSEALLSMGLFGKKIMLYGENTYEWAIADLSIMGFIGVNVSINKEWKENDIHNILDFVDVAAIIYSNNNLEVIDKIKQQHEKITYISMQDDFAELLEKGHQILKDKENKYDFPEVNREDMCKIVFSSGTTSTPKAAMLSQKNMLCTWEELNLRMELGEKDRCFIFLPLNFTYAGILNFLYSLLGGWQVYLCSDKDSVISDLRIVKPTIFSAVPLIYEKVYNSIDKKTMYLLQVLIKISNLLLKLKIDVRNKFFKEIHHQLGGNQGYLICAGAHFNRKVKKFFRGVGFNMVEGYGLTETSSILSCAYADDDVHSVGTIFERLDVKILNPNRKGYGEILVKGDNLCIGYYNNQKANDEAFDKEGYFHTGDIGRIGKYRQLYLKGRKKRVIITSNGFNVYPDELENLFENEKGINKAKVYEKNQQIFARIYVKDHQIKVHKVIERVNKKLPYYKKIKDYDVVLDSIDTRIK